MDAVTLVLEVTGTISVTAPVGREYTYGAASPSGAPASWLAIAHRAENIGQATLVPPHTCQTCSGTWPGMLIRIATPVNGSASQEISGTWRYLPGNFF